MLLVWPFCLASTLELLAIVLSDCPRLLGCVAACVGLACVPFRVRVHARRLPPVLFRHLAARSTFLFCGRFHYCDSFLEPTKHTFQLFRLGSECLHLMLT